MTVEVDVEDTKSARDLFRDSREGLGFIDEQIFGSEAGDKLEEKRASEKVFEDTKKVEKISKSEQRTPKTVKNTPKAVKMTQETVKNATLISEHASEMVEQVLSGSPHETSLITKSKPTAVKIPRERTEAVRDELYKNRTSRKIGSRRLFSREYDFRKTFSLTENQFSGKTYFYTIASRDPPKKLPEDVVRETLAKADAFLQRERQNNKRPSERPYMPVKNRYSEFNAS